VHDTALAAHFGITRFRSTSQLMKETHTALGRIQVYRTSAKTGYNVVDLFVGVARDADSEMMAARMQNTNFVSPTSSADLSKKACVHFFAPAFL
jgi:hypothetical protein